VNDPLRFLRVVRFTAQMSLTIEKATAEECRAVAP
jgi:tRNA nucleotidyltransferase/poly(A) polymerase